MTRIIFGKRTRFYFALCIPLLTLVVQWLLWMFINPFVWFLFYPAVFFSARIGGLKAGLISTLLSVVLVWFFFLSPSFSFSITNPHNLFPMFVFCLMGYLMSNLQENLKQANLKAFEALNAAKVANKQVYNLYQKSLDADKIKTHFFTNVSHELRTPLTLILNPLGEMLKRDGLDANERYDLEIMERNARILYRHVSDLLDISKLEAKQMAMTYSRINISDCTRLVTSYFESVASSNQIIYSIHLPDSLTVEIDEVKYQRILQNLLSNAFRFTPKGGMINVTVICNESSFYLDVEDSGPGIPNNQREKIFERFQQVDRQGRIEYGGTGLGLAIVKEFVELHNGTVSVTDSIHNGALFRVALPIKAPSGILVSDSSSLHDVADIAYSTTGLLKANNHGEVFGSAPLSSILIVDDNHDITDFITRALAPEFLVSTASNGKEGLERAKVIKPDLIISDIMMPLMTGDEMIELIHGIPELADTPIIILTAVSDEKLKLKLLRQSVQDFIAKPFSIEELRYKVGSIINRTVAQRTKVAEAERRYKYALDNMLEGCQILSTDWEYVYINEAAQKQNRRSSSELIGNRYMDMWPGVEQTHVFSLIKECIEKRTSHYFENEFIFPDGQQGWFELSIHPIPEGVFILSVDITARKKAEQNMKETELELKKAQHIAGLGYWTWYIQENKLDWSDEMFSIFGIDRLTFNGKLDEVIAQAIHPDDRAAVDRANLSVVEKGISIPVEYRVVWLDGTVHYLWAEAGELINDSNGHPMVLKGIVQDITQRKLIEQEITHAKEMAEESDRLKSAFLANMSHEIRTPMNAIIGFADFLKKPDLEESKRLTFTNIIQSRSYDLLHIIEDILDVSKIEVGQLKIVLEPTGLSVMLTELLDFYKGFIATSNDKAAIQIVLVLPPDLANAVIITDGLRLRQVLGNLIDNAIKFTAKGVVEFGVMGKSETELTFYVKDTGIGIAANMQTLIFDRFRQAEDAYTNRQYGGTGLGLSIVKGILKALNSNVTVVSEIGKGSMFSFNLPIEYVKQTDQLDSHFDAVRQVWTNKSILIVEDDEFNSLYLKELLEGHGLNLLFASTGKQAIDLFNTASRIDLVLMDIRLPDSNGFDVTRYLKMKNPYLVVIAQTAYASAVDVKECLDAGCNDYISKPINKQALFELLDTYLSVVRNLKGSV